MAVLTLLTSHSPQDSLSHLTLKPQSRTLDGFTKGCTALTVSFAT